MDNQEDYLKNIVLKRAHQSLRSSGLRARMTISYVGVTLISLMFAFTIIFLLIFILYPFVLGKTTSGHLASEYTLQAKQQAELFALAASSQSAGPVLNPQSTFQPGQPTTLVSSLETFNPDDISDHVGEYRVQYINTPVTDTAITNKFALLITPNGHILSSSYPQRYPSLVSVSSLLPERMQMIRAALTGKSISITSVIPSSSVFCAVEPVWTKEHRLLGAVYVQLVTVTPVLQDQLMRLWTTLLPFTLLCSLIVAPIGGLFGLITTRSLIQRLCKLATTTTRFSNGDYSQRVLIAGNDEIGQLEYQFNCMARQIVESISNRQELTEQNARLAERAHISRELHDVIAQDLFSLRLMMDGMQEATSAGVPIPNLEQSIAVMTNITTAMTHEMKALLMELRPTQLEGLRLTQALKELACAYHTRLGIIVETSIAPVTLSTKIEYTLLRIAQEALSNAARHSKATQISLSLNIQDTIVTLTITDNGHGFSLDESQKKYGLGLSLMQERIKELNGNFVLDTGIGLGTYISASCTVGDR